MPNIRLKLNLLINTYENIYFQNVLLAFRVSNTGLNIASLILTIIFLIILYRYFRVSSEV